MKTQEQQNIEWKQSWRDEYLGWICGFANADGGKLYLGKNDKGEVIKLENVKKLLEDIPNKVRDVLGIIVDVNLLTENENDYIEIVTESYPYPINYRGDYHYRTGSTKQILKGAALNKFILGKTGKHWDAIPVPNISVAELETESIERFKKFALKSRRLDKSVLDDDTTNLLDSLHLLDNSLLKRAAVLLFHSTPEKYVTGAYVKIGFFETDTELLFQDEVQGSLFSQVEKTMDLLLTKYTIAHIEYNGLNREEKHVLPESALREALLNAIAHKDYSTGNPIQISVYRDKLQIYNDGKIPVEWSLEKFLGKHPSKPANPDIANTFFRAGYIEAWGRGVNKIVEECEKAQLLRPVFNFDFDGLRIEFNMNTPKPVIQKNNITTSFEASSGGMKFLISTELMEQIFGLNNISLQDATIDDIEKIKHLEPKSLKMIVFLFENTVLKRKELLQSVGITNHSKNSKRFIEPLLHLNIINYTIKDKPNSALQKYILTAFGKRIANLLKEGLENANEKINN